MNPVQEKERSCLMGDKSPKNKEKRKKKQVSIKDKRKAKNNPVSTITQKP